MHSPYFYLNFITFSRQTFRIPSTIDERSCRWIVFHSRLAAPVTRLTIDVCLATQALFDDLARHFQISRNASQVGTILVNLLYTDFSCGLAADALSVLRGNQDTLLTKMAQNEVTVALCFFSFVRKFFTGLGMQTRRRAAAYVAGCC